MYVAKDFIDMYNCFFQSSFRAEELFLRVIVFFRAEELCLQEIVFSELLL